MPYKLEDEDLDAKKQRMIAGLDQMAQMAQARKEQSVPQEPEAPMMPQANPSAPVTPAQPSPDLSAVQPKPNLMSSVTPEQPKSDWKSTLKSVLGYALPMAFSASRGMGLLPGAASAFSAQNKAGQVSNQQAIEKMKEQNATEFNRQKEADLELQRKALQNNSDRDYKLKELIESGNASNRNLETSLKASKNPIEIAHTEAETEKLQKKTPLERITDMILGSQTSSKGSSKEVHAPKPEDKTYQQYLKRVNG